MSTGAWGAVDIAIFAFVAIAAASGAHRGLVRSALGLAATVLALGIAGHAYPSVARLLRRYIPLSMDMGSWVAFFVLFAAVQAVCIVVLALLALPAKLLPEGFAGRAAGALISAYRSALLSTALLVALAAFPHRTSVALRTQGPVAREVVRIAMPLFGQLVPMPPGTGSEAVWRFYRLRSTTRVAARAPSDFSTAQ